MSILDKASLIQIPSGYKSTKLYSLRPSNGDGDFTFARSSSATRVNSEGLIEVAKVLGTTEEVTNGDFATDSDWVKAPSGVTISGGSANFNASADSYVYQDIITVGKTYKVTFSGVITSGAFYIGENGQAVNIFTSGTYVNQEATFTVLASTRFIIRASSVPFIGSIDNVSVKEVFENDVPRLDYSGGASCASLLLEPQRTNVINYSNNYTLWSNTQFTINSNSVTSPEGITNGTKIVPSTSNTDKYLDKGGFSRTSGQYITHTVYAKASGYNFLYLSNSASRLYAVYDLQQGLVIYNNSNGTDFNNHSASIELFGNGWYRCELIGQAQTSFASYFRISCGITAINSSTQGLFQGDGTSGIEVYGSQVELNTSYATSYIPTSGSTVTRTADVCNNAGTSATFNSTEGVLFAEIAALTEVGDGTTRLSISDGTQDNNITIGYSATNTLRTIIRSGASNQALMTSSQTITNYLKVGVKYKANDFALWVNGVEVATDTSGLAPVGLSELSFDRGDAALPFYGKTKQLMTFDEALSDEELSDLTGQVNLSFNNLATFYGYTIL